MKNRGSCSRSKMRSANAEAGFTLVEMLTALILMAMISVLIFGGVSFGARIWERGNGLSEGWRDISVARQFLDRQLSRIYPEYLDPVLNLRRVTFLGKPDEMLFTAPLPSRLQEGGNQRFALYLDEQRDGKDIKLDWVFDEEVDDPRDHKDHQSVTIMSGIRKLQFTYVDDEGDLSESWTEANKIPSEIRIAVEKEEEADANWPLLVVKPMVQVDVECVYDPVTRSCRGRYE